jgi:epoxyqueuosine reductase
VSAALKSEIAALAREVGFDAFGVAEARPLDDERTRLRKWLARGHHGSMQYLERLESERLDPAALLPGAQSVLCFAHSYAVEQDVVTDDPRDESLPRIARYARGRDYHKVLRAKLRRVAERITEREPSSESRVCVDTAPILEKAWAERCGIGWRGKHTNVVSRDLGSWTFLGTLLTTVALPADEPHTDYCGSCRRCLDACPTSAFPEPYVMDATRCISYLTIEHRGEFTDAEGASIGDHLFGCDICLEVCPWTRFTSPTDESDFQPRTDVIDRSLETWVAMDEDEYDQITRGSAMRRARHDGLTRNARHAARNRSRTRGGEPAKKGDL